MLLYDLFQNKKYVQDVLKAFFKASVFTKLNKCQFNIRCILFIGFVNMDKSI